MAPPLIFVRHGETDWNVAGRLQGQTDTPLNPKGRDQADAVGRTLASAFPDLSGHVFVASPLERASETMRRVRAGLGLDPEAFAVDDRLKEMTFGRWEGSTFADIRTREPAVMKARDADRWGHRPPGGESYQDVSDRFAEFLAGLEGPAVVVSHGGVARVALALIGGGDRKKLPHLHVQQGRAMLIENGRWRWV
ncbi:histidine phosphatase family protein [Chelatococcus sambhunathii]|uniref:Histidine phosphatase family protein n=1 Tax=Chelatococcus sambhunathii TaxID=363953 RepID=A0ABU1DIK5_9HYPH|nr:histidine phosphatase family protein [Chelatococcus sambhunathii]MDR4307943.1 histidine phosphatase family protein [Chelatococcus sambhunathii]